MPRRAAPRFVAYFREGLAAAKARGVKLGNPRLEIARRRSLAVRQAHKPAADLVSHVTGMRAQGLSSAEIARRLNRLEVRTPRNKTWWPASVAKIVSAAR
jgi:DNA invertase Pin-like site-specific DNA recombinase